MGPWTEFRWLPLGWREREPTTDRFLLYHPRAMKTTRKRKPGRSLALLVVNANSIHCHRGYGRGVAHEEKGKLSCRGRGLELSVECPSGVIHVFREESCAPTGEDMKMRNNPGQHTLEQQKRLHAGRAVPRTAAGRKLQRSSLIGEKAEEPTSRKPKEERILRTKKVNGIRGPERSNNLGKTLTRPEKCLLDLAKWNSLVTSGGRRTPDCRGAKGCGLLF